jgi:hypothetical protein
MGSAMLDTVVSDLAELLRTLPLADDDPLLAELVAVATAVAANVAAAATLLARHAYAVAAPASTSVDEDADTVRLPGLPSS